MSTAGLIAGGLECAENNGVSRSIGWMLLLIPVALVIYAGIRLAPIYLNYTRVARSLSQVAEEAKGDGSTNATHAPRRHREALRHRGHRVPEDARTSPSSATANPGSSNRNYEETAPMFSNIALLVTFKKSERVGKSVLD